MGRTVQRQLREGLARIDNSQLPGKLKMDGIANSYIRKWLGLPRCFSNVGLFGKNMLQLPLKSINLGYRQKKTHLLLELGETRDEAVKGAAVMVRTGRKWRAQYEVDQAVSRLQHKEILGRVQDSRAGLGWGQPVQFWSKATRDQRKAMVVEEVSQVEKDHYLVKSQLSFLIRETYDTLPCPRNLAQWFGSEGKCFLCSKDNAGLQHILSGCNISLTQGCFQWQHNQVLRKLAEYL
ncbi:hypothetical protein F2P79_020824%2C partial [Xyrichtys novacula]|uniref:Reverse transcriptase n=1 Tax=Xyrichtys novacula TaxID=13765 RepID=A0AAV1F8Z0_XYRNO|nr:hypothetical protein F2P79_020824%2C partial [Xyrichtys novacula]